MADTVIVGFWLTCLIRGFFRGALKELFSIAGVLLGMIAAAFHFSILSGGLPPWSASLQWRDLIGFLVLFVSIYLMVTLAGVVVSYLIGPGRPGWVNRLVGAGFGTVKGVLAVSALLVPLVAFVPKQAAGFGGSRFLPFENRIAESMAAVVPATMHVLFVSHVDGCKQSWTGKAASVDEQ